MKPHCKPSTGIVRMLSSSVWTVILKVLSTETDSRLRRLIYPELVSDVFDATSTLFCLSLNVALAFAVLKLTNIVKSIVSPAFTQKVPRVYSEVRDYWVLCDRDIGVAFDEKKSVITCLLSRAETESLSVAISVVPKNSDTRSLR